MIRKEHWLTFDANLHCWTPTFCRVLAVCALCLPVAVPRPAAAQKLPAQSAPANPPAPPADNRTPIETASPDMPELVNPQSYRIGIEDFLSVDVFGEEKLGGRVVVRPDGMITLRLIPDILVNNMTPDELKKKLTEEYSKIAVNPVVTVQVMAVRSKKYYITGHGASRSGVFPLVTPIRVLEALIQAGGLSEWADKKNIVIRRGTQSLKFNYNDAIKGKNPAQNIYLENGDIVFVE